MQAIKTSCSLMAAASLSLFMQPAFAQVEGQLQQFQREYMERQREQALDRLNENKEDGVRIDQSLTGGNTLDESLNVSFDLSDVTFRVESKLVPISELRAVASTYIGQTVSIADLNAMILSMNQHYRAKGHHNAQVILPPQQIANGVVELLVIESTVADLVIDETTTWSGFYDDRIKLQSGQLLNLNDLSTRINWLNRTTDLRVTASLQPGNVFGTTDVNLQVIEPPRQQLSLTADNWGYRTTGSDRGTLTYTNNNVFGSRDRLDVSYTGANTADTGFVSYAVPVNRYNGRIGALHAVNEVEILNQEIGDIIVIGKSKETTLYFSQPLYVDTHFKLQASVGYSHVPGETYVDGVKVLETDLDESYISADIEYIGETSYFFTDARYVAARPGQDYDPGMNYSRGSLVWVKRAANDVYTLATGQWQFTSASALPSSRFFQVGGPTSVRGYPTGAVSSINGYALNYEFHYEYKGLDVFAFIDNGWAEALGNRPERLETLASAGVGAQYRSGPFTVAAHWGKPIKEGRVEGDDEGRWHLRMNIDLLSIINE